MRYLDFSSPKSVMRSIFFEVFISVRSVYVRACVFVCVWGVEVGILIVLLSAGEGSVKIASSGMSCKCVVCDGYFHFAYSHVQYY